MTQSSKLLWSYIIADWCVSSAVSFNSTLQSSPLWSDQSSSVYTPQPHTVKPIAETHNLKMEYILTVFFLSLMSECFFSPRWTIHFHIGNYFHLAPKQDLILYFLLTMLSSFILCFELARNCCIYVMHKSKPAIPLLHTLKYMLIFYHY